MLNSIVIVLSCFGTDVTPFEVEVNNNIVKKDGVQYLQSKIDDRSIFAYSKRVGGTLLEGHTSIDIDRFDGTFYAETVVTEKLNNTQTIESSKGECVALERKF